MGSYEPRHIKTTVKVVPEKGASTPAGTRETDGWYIDLPGFGCSRPTSETGQGLQLGFTYMSPNASPDHVVIKRLGTAPHGLAVEETTIQRTGGNVITSKIKLLEFSEQPLEASLFEVPPDYSPAQFRDRQNLHIKAAPEPRR